MSRASTVVLGIVSAAFVTWLAAASTTEHRPSASRATVDADRSTAARVLVDDVERLRRRLEVVSAVTPPARNPFRYVQAAPALGGARHAIPQAPADVPLSAVPQADAAFELVGMAESDADAAGTVPQRTAILSVGGQVIFAREGDTVAGRFRLTRVEAESVQLTDPANESVVHLRLK